MSDEEYHAAYLGRVGSDRMSQRLSIIPDRDRGDLDEVTRLRKALKFIACDVRCYSLDVATGAAREALES